MTEIVILDVGHGNCGILVDSGAVTLIDAPLGATHILELRRRGIRCVDTVVVSHADADHCGGVITLLLDPVIHVRRVLLNPDAAKRTGAWEDLMIALRDAETRWGTQLQTSLTTTTPDVTGGHAELTIEVLAPHPTLVAKGPGSTHKGRPVSSNTASAVVRVSQNGHPVVLFAGDIDRVGLEDLIAGGMNTRAPILVYPHHGGTSGGGNPGTFAEALYAVVQPATIVFSIARSRPVEPREDVIVSLRGVAFSARIVCTQLSSQCASALPIGPSDHLSVCCSKGSYGRAACAGSLSLTFEGTRILVSPDAEAHSAFIRAQAPTALCRPLPVAR